MATIDIKVQADVADAVRDLKKVEDGIDDTAKATGKFTPSLADMKAGFDMASQAAAEIALAIDAVVAPTMELAKQQRDLARASGQSAEDAGAVIQSADDLGVSYETLLGASKKLNAEGFSLNIENLKKLSDDYQKLPSPVAKAQFAMEKFGRASGPEMQKLLEQGGAAIQKMTDEARKSALVMSGADVDAAREYEIALDGMNDAVTEAKVLMGVELIPVLTAAANVTTSALVPAVKVAADTFGAAMTTVAQYSTLVQIAGQYIAYSTGTMKQATYEANLYTIANNGISKAEEEAAKSQAIMSAETERWTGLAGTYTAAATALAASQNVAMTATDLLAAGMQKYTDLLLFNKAAADLDADAALALGIAMGVVDTTSLLAAQSVEVLKAKYDTNHDGAISATEATSGYTAAVLALQQGIAALPPTTNIDVNVRTNYTSTGSSSSANVGGVPTVGPGGQAVGYADGGDFVVDRPSQLLVGEVGRERVTITPMNQGRTTSPAPAGNTYNLYMTNNGGTPSVPDLFQQQQQANAGAW